MNFRPFLIPPIGNLTPPLTAFEAPSLEILLALPWGPQ